jgi:dethiobiotin synthetase
MPPLIIYIAGFRQHAGKTVTSLGLISLLEQVMDPERIGYIKPVGQELVRLPDDRKVDKDAMIVDRFSGIPDIDMNYVSPVQLASGFTKEYLASDHPELISDRLRNDILEAVSAIEHKSVVIAEGTGHPGVGGIVGLSNAHVANLTGAQMLYLSGAGIGKAIDMLEVDLTFFMYHNVKMRGILFNKVFKSKIDQIKRLITEDVLNRKYCFDKPLRIFGFLPELEDLGRPSMSVIRESFKESCVIGDAEADAWRKPCRTIRVISLQDEYLTLGKYLGPGDLVVIGSGSARRISRILEYSASLPEPLHGIVLTCGGETLPDDSLYGEIERSGIPGLVVLEDTATTEARILETYENTKLQIYDADKYREIRTMFAEHFEFEKFLETFGIGVE